VLIADERQAKEKSCIASFRELEIDADVVGNGNAAIDLCEKIAFDVVVLGETLDDEADPAVVRDSIRANAVNKRIKVVTLSDKPEGFDGTLGDFSQASLKELVKKFVPEVKINIVSRVGYTGKGLDALEDLGLNTREAIDNFNGDEDEYKEVLLTLCRSSDTKGKLLNHYIETHDYKNYIVAMHGILGVARVIGADWLATKSRELEKAAKQGIYSIIEKETGALSEYFEKLLSSIRTVLSQKKSEGIQGEISKPDLISIVTELKASLAEYQLDEVEELFFTLAQFSYPDPGVMELIHSAEEYMLGFQYTDVESCLDEIMKRLGE